MEQMPHRPAPREEQADPHKRTKNTLVLGTLAAMIPTAIQEQSVPTTGTIDPSIPVSSAGIIESIDTSLPVLIDEALSNNPPTERYAIGTTSDIPPAYNYTHPYSFTDSPQDVPPIEHMQFPAASDDESRYSQADLHTIKSPEQLLDSVQYLEARRLGIDPALFVSRQDTFFDLLVYTESRHNAEADNPHSSALGFMQFLTANNTAGQSNGSIHTAIQRLSNQQKRLDIPYALPGIDELYHDPTTIVEMPLLSQKILAFANLIEIPDTDELFVQLTSDNISVVRDAVIGLYEKHHTDIDQPRVRENLDHALDKYFPISAQNDQQTTTTNTAPREQVIRPQYRPQSLIQKINSWRLGLRPRPRPNDLSYPVRQQSSASQSQTEHPSGLNTTSPFIIRRGF